MTVKAKELLGKLELLREQLRKRDKMLREEVESEATHVSFLDDNLQILAQTVEILRAVNPRGRSVRTGNRELTPTSISGYNKSRHTIHPCMANLQKLIQHKRNTLSGDWNGVVSSRKDKPLEYPLTTLRNQNSTSTLENRSKSRTNAYINNLYYKNFGISETTNPKDQVSITKSPNQHFRKKTESHRANIGGGSLSENRRSELEQSKSLVKFTYNPPENVFGSHKSKGKTEIVSPSDLSPQILNKKKYSMNSEGYQAMRPLRESDRKFVKKPPEIQTTINFEEGEVTLFREAFSNKAASKASASFAKGQSMHLDSVPTSNVQSINLKRRETLGAKPKIGSPNRGAYDSPSKLPLGNKMNSDLAKENPVEINMSWSKLKDRHSKQVSQDLSKAYGSAGASASKLINQLSRARIKNHEVLNSKLQAMSKKTITEYSVPEHHMNEGRESANDETVRIEEESDKKTEKKSSPINRTNVEMCSDSSRMNHPQNIVLKEMSHRSEFLSESQSIVADSSKADN